MMSAILEGIRILAAAQWLPAGAGYMLGDLGADVIKVEVPTGDAYRGMTSVYGDAVSTPGGRHIGFETVNRNQRSITINLKSPKGREVLNNLVRQSDVFLTNYSEDVLKALHADYETLSLINPKLIYAIASSYGPEGPWSKKRAFDFTVQAYSGLMSVMGDRDSAEPTQCVGAIIDTMQATVTAYGILAAIVARERLGIGQKIDTSLLGSALHLQGTAFNVASIKGRTWARHSRAKTKSPLSNYYRCADGKWLAFSELQVGRFWSEVCDVLGIKELEHDPRFATNEAKREHAAEMIRLLDSVIATKTRDEWLEIFAERESTFSYAPVHQYAELKDDPQVLENGYVVEFDHPAEGRLKLIGFPVRFSKTPARIIREAPELGQHTEEILTEVCDYSWDEITALRNEGAI